MAKLDEAKKILKALGLPPAQQTNVAAYTLLALANISRSTPWISAERRSIGIHDILQFIKVNYRKPYAENSRETVRRQVLHQFEQARVIDRNPDDPALPTNSPRTHYAISVDALNAIQSFGTRSFSEAAALFVTSHGKLSAVYQAGKDRQMVPLRLPSGQMIMLSPGKHNELQVSIIMEFAPRFAPGAMLLYVGDTAHKTLHLEAETLEHLGVPITKHDKLPDVALYLEERNWLLLIEAVTSHGPVSPKRRFELEEVLASCTADRVYISAFHNFREFRRHVADIAWETEVWLAETPDHLIHFNGEKFLGPASPSL